MLCKIARHANTIKVNILKWNIAGETSTWISIFENVSIMQPVLQNYGDTTQAVTISGVPGPLQKQLTLELQGCQYYLYILTLSRLYCTVEKLNICCCHLLFVLSRSSMYWQQKAFLIPNIFMNKGLFQGGKKICACWQIFVFYFFCFSLMIVVQVMTIPLFFFARTLFKQLKHFSIFRISKLSFSNN